LAKAGLRKEEEMCRASVHRWIAALALVAALGLVGAKPAAAADLRGADRLASLWSVVTARPVAFWNTLIGWLGGPEKSTSPDTDRDWLIDPNGGVSTQPSNVPADGPN
jgi:hypothetical protein